MPTVKELRQIVRQYKSENCPPYSRERKANLKSIIERHNIPLPVIERVVEKVAQEVEQLPKPILQELIAKELPVEVEVVEPQPLEPYVRKVKEPFTRDEIINDVVNHLPNNYYPTGSVARNKQFPGDLDLVVLNESVSNIIKEFKDNFNFIDAPVGGKKAVTIFIDLNGRPLEINAWVADSENFAFKMFARLYPTYLDIAIKQKFKKMGWKLTENDLTNDKGKKVPVLNYYEIFDLVNFPRRSPEEAGLKEAEKAKPKAKKNKREAKKVKKQKQIEKIYEEETAKIEEQVEVVTPVNAIIKEILDEFNSRVGEKQFREAKIMVDNNQKLDEEIYKFINKRIEKDHYIDNIDFFQRVLRPKIKNLLGKKFTKYVIFDVTFDYVDSIQTGADYEKFKPYTDRMRAYFIIESPGRDSFHELKGVQKARQYLQDYGYPLIKDPYGAGFSFKTIYQGIKSIFTGPRKGMPPPFKEFLEKYGNANVNSVVVCRDPINKAIDTVLNVITFGAFGSAKKKYAYDDLYHLYIIAHCKAPDGKLFGVRIEKNHVASIKMGHPSSECRGAPPVKQPLTLNQLIENGAKLQGDNFWLYDPIKNNCQVFIYHILKANNLLKPDLEKFVKQDATNLLTGPASKFAKLLTDVAGVADVFLHGSRLKKMKGGCEIESCACDVY
jgi:hypothetical protein